jgi:hypothetical protein
MSFLSYSQNAFLKWRQKLLAPELWLGWEFVIMNLVCAPGGKAFWKDRGYMFGEGFRRYVENDLRKGSRTPGRSRSVRFQSAGALNRCCDDPILTGENQHEGK